MAKRWAGGPETVGSSPAIPTAEFRNTSCYNDAMDIIFKEYTDNDKIMLLSLRRKLAEYSKEIDPIKRVRNFPGFSEMALNEILENVEKYQGKIWLAIHNDKAIGYIAGAIWEQSKQNKLEIGPHKLGEVLQVFLEEEYRRKGIGTQMITMMENYFKGEKCDSVWIEVFAPNTLTYSLYKKFGFIDREIGMLKSI